MIRVSFLFKLDPHLKFYSLQTVVFGVFLKATFFTN